MASSVRSSEESDISEHPHQLERIAGERLDDGGEADEGRDREHEGEEHLEGEAQGEGVEGGRDPGEQAHADVGEEEHDDERAGDLHGREQHLPGALDEQRAGDRRGERRADRQRLEGADQAADDEQVAAGGEQQRDRGHLEQAGELGAVDHRLRVEALREREAAEQVDEAARGLHRGEGDEDEEAEQRAGHQLEHERHEEIAGAALHVALGGARRHRQRQADGEHPLHPDGERAGRERRGDDEERDHAHGREAEGLQPAEVDREGHGRCLRRCRAGRGCGRRAAS
ncbi:hypothetical protein GCM10025874_10800 [Arenivirga flava]|uniref:Uncharacterized protein n=1 Tax=Arenivirga flava TaxID=1930060 RepID=A0AA37XBY6_9MICO|nr:hypothetical protein GCM10025874_10800 [Arenivirga flava]